MRQSKEEHWRLDRRQAADYHAGTIPSLPYTSRQRGVFVCSVRAASMSTAHRKVLQGMRAAVMRAVCRLRGGLTVGKVLP
jgi:hypothetical protein